MGKFRYTQFFRTQFFKRILAHLRRRQRGFRRVAFVFVSFSVTIGYLSYLESKEDGGDRRKLPNLRPMSVAEPDPPKDHDLMVREEMLKISKQLGVTCNYCHDVTNFKSNRIPAFGVALDHIKLVELLKRTHFSGNDKQINCYLCHRGQPKPAVGTKF